MTGVSWRDGAQELRRSVVAEGGDPDRIEDVGVIGRQDDRPGLLLIRRFNVPAVDWLELTFARDITAAADDFWTAARSGDFAPEDVTAAEELVTSLGLGRPLRSRIGLVNPN